MISNTNWQKKTSNMDKKELSHRTAKPSSLNISFVAWNIPVYFDVPDQLLRTTAQEDVGSICTCQQRWKKKHLLY